MEEHMDSAQPEVEWLTLKAAAQRVAKSTKTLRRAIKAGQLVAQRSGDSEAAPWVVSSRSLDETYGPPAQRADSVIEDPVLMRSLLRQNDSILAALNDSEARAREALERAVRAETIAEHLTARLAELREEQRAADEQPTQPERTRWWRRTPTAR